jgi:hypothetical protein
MAWQVIRQHKQNSLTVEAEPSDTTETQMFLVFEDDPTYSPTEELIDIYELVKGTTAPFDGIPKIGSRLYLSGNMAKQLIVDSIDVRPTATRANCYEVIVRARTPLLGDMPYKPVKYQIQSASRVVDYYVDAASGPANFDAPIVPSSLIAGTAVNVMGDPWKYRVPQANILVETSYNPRLDSASVYMADMPDPVTLAGLCFSRNSAAWLGWPIGSVLFTGFEERQLSQQVIQVSWNFTYDQIGFLEQVPYRRPNDGGLWLDSGYAWGGIAGGARGTTKVAWRQPYQKAKINFNTAGVLFPTVVKSSLDTDYPTW